MSANCPVGCNCNTCRVGFQTYGMNLWLNVAPTTQKVNRDGVPVVKGEGGHYYCGRKGLYTCLNTCDGVCGPTNGCNCSACRELDKSEGIPPYSHPKGTFRKNKDGYPVVRGGGGRYYCGRRGLYKCLYLDACDGMCGPDDGCNCPACKELDKADGIPPYKHRYVARMNRDGVAVKKGYTGNYYCGRKGLYTCKRGCDGYCGPNNGCNCPACAELDRAEGIPRYH